MMDPQNENLTAEADLEWQRLRLFLRSEGAAIAVAEVESAAHAADVLARIPVAGGVAACAYHLTDSRQSGDLMDWLESVDSTANEQTVRVVAGTEAFAADPSKARAFWTWLNVQRERLKPPLGKLLFLLTPPHVNHLARHADALWDWIPLKFNLLRREPPPLRRQRQEQMADLNGPDRAASLKMLPALREQLFSARQRGLPETIVRRDYAWPLFEALVDTGHLREAKQLLRTDLHGDFADELDATQRPRWFLSLGYLNLNLGNVADADQAFRQLHREAEDRGDVAAAATACFGLGRVHEWKWDLAQAEQWYLKSLKISEKLGDEHGAASTYHQLGIIAEERRDFDQAEQWYLKSLKINEKLGDEHGAASTYGQLGILNTHRQRFAEAGQWLIKCIQSLAKCGDGRNAGQGASDLASLCHRAPPPEAARLRELWQQAGLPPLPPPEDSQQA